MSYRDDHQAAVTRVEALEHELEAERRATAQQAAQIAKLEQEVARLRARTPRVDPVAESKRVEPTRAQGLLGVMIGLFAISLGALAYKACSFRKLDAPAYVERSGSGEPL
jgi:hypothetical protein